MELSLQVQQKQILSQKMQQSVEILQMNAVTLSEYIREFAEENPLVEWNEEKEPVQQENTELLQKLEWLWQKRGAESARISSFSDKYTKNSGRT